MKYKLEDMTTVVKCASVSEAQKCARFINDWQTLIYASWCGNEVTIKVRTQSPNDHAYYELDEYQILEEGKK